MKPQSNSDPLATIPGIKPRWPWLFAITGVPTLLAAWVVWQQMDRIDRLRFENFDVRSAKDKLDAEATELRKQKVELEKRLTAAEETSKADDIRIRESQDDTKKLKDELRAVRANAQVYVSRPLDAKVKPLGLFSTDSWKFEWSLRVMNPSSQPVKVFMNVYCVASNEGSPVLNEWPGLTPVIVDAAKEQTITDSISLNVRHCPEGARSRILAFAKMGDAPAIPIDVWPHGTN